MNYRFKTIISFNYYHKTYGEKRRFKWSDVPTHSIFEFTNKHGKLSKGRKRIVFLRRIIIYIKNMFSFVRDFSVTNIKSKTFHTIYSNKRIKSNSLLQLAMRTRDKNGTMIFNGDTVIIDGEEYEAYVPVADDWDSYGVSPMFTNDNRWIKPELDKGTWADKRLGQKNGRLMNVEVVYKGHVLFMRDEKYIDNPYREM